MDIDELDLSGDEHETTTRITAAGILPFVRLVVALVVALGERTLRGALDRARLLRGAVDDAWTRATRAEEERDRAREVALQAEKVRDENEALRGRIRDLEGQLAALDNPVRAAIEADDRATAERLFRVFAEATGAGARVPFGDPQQVAIWTAVAREMRATVAEAAKARKGDAWGVIGQIAALVLPGKEEPTLAEIVAAVKAGAAPSPDALVTAEALWADYRRGRNAVTANERAAFLAGVEAGRETAQPAPLTEEEQKDHVAECAEDLWRCASAWDPDVRLLGNLTAREIAEVARRASRGEAPPEVRAVAGESKVIECRGCGIMCETDASVTAHLCSDCTGAGVTHEALDAAEYWTAENGTRHAKLCSGEVRNGRCHCGAVTHLTPAAIGEIIDAAQEQIAPCHAPIIAPREVRYQAVEKYDARIKAEQDDAPDSVDPRDLPPDSEDPQIIEGYTDDGTIVPCRAPSRLCVAVLVTDPSDRVLLVESNKGGDRAWELPGGKRHLGEGARAAARREVREETGLDVSLSLDEPITLPATGAHPEALLFRARGEGVPTAGGDARRAAWWTAANVLDFDASGFLSDLASRDVLLAWAREQAGGQ